MKNKTARRISKAKKKAQKRVKELMARFRRGSGAQQVGLHRELKAAHHKATKLERAEIDHEVKRYAPATKWQRGD
jgi:hypothetical protein